MSNTIFTVVTTSNDNWITHVEVFETFTNAVNEFNSSCWDKKEKFDEKELAHDLLTQGFCLETWTKKDSITKHSVILNLKELR